ncbi:MAG: GyrI-like domain-containing protein [Acidobacteriota bacterium]
MNLNEQYDIVYWPETYYAFVEKVGPFQAVAPAAWQAAHGLAPDLNKNNRVTGYITLYRVPQQVYRAGFALEAPPTNLPAGLRYEPFPGGKYAKFTLTGPYSDLPQASSRVFEIIEQQDLPTRDDFYIESYVNDPRTTPESELITDILVPIR